MQTGIWKTFAQSRNLQMFWVSTSNASRRKMSIPDVLVDRKQGKSWWEYKTRAKISQSFPMAQEMTSTQDDVYFYPSEIIESQKTLEDTENSKVWRVLRLAVFLGLRHFNHVLSQKSCRSSLWLQRTWPHRSTWLKVRPSLVNSGCEGFMISMSLCRLHCTSWTFSIHVL